nr:arrestin domain-containing protein 3-like [Ciona intestinalis]|eukprot:XP_002123090.1 arrestin domain-containing protein 3-like [Ciona intestinalis]
MGVKNFTVQFHDNKVIYSPGQPVNGSILIELEEPMRMKAVKIKFSGKAQVSWTETRSTGKTTYTVRYSSCEQYFKEEVSVYGEGSVGAFANSEELPAGQSVFPFQFFLPPTLPSSFEGAHGHVRYLIHASIDRPWHFDPKTKAAFTVLDSYDLNLETDARISPTAEDSKTICCWCCASNPITAVVRADRTGYVPGEFITINATAENGSTRKLKLTRASVVQKVRFMAVAPHKKTRTWRKSMADVEGPAVTRRQTIHWNNERIQIPALPPSELRNCNIMNIEHYLEFRVVLPRLSKDLCVKVPIKLGTVPLQGITPYSQLPPTMPQPGGEIPLQPTATAPTPQPMPPAYQMPPPSYMAVVGGEVAIKDDDDNNHMMGGQSFAPQYTYYDWSQSAFTYN